LGGIHLSDESGGLKSHTILATSSKKEAGMSHNYEINSPGNSISAERPKVTSYDACNEHSVEHWVDLRVLVEESEKETPVIAKPPSEP
jgi:hypothetical protein